MNKKKIALFIDTEKKTGGAYQEAIYTAQNITKKENNKFEFIIISLSKNINHSIKEIKILNLKLNLFQKLVCYLRTNIFFFQKIINKFFFKNYFESFLKENKIDFIYFLNSSQYTQYLESMNFIINIPDLAHRKNVEFPEVRNSSEFEIRERIYKNFLPKAYSVITNSETIKYDLIKYYNLDEDRVKIIRHQPSQHVINFKYSEVDEEKVKKKYNLPNKYIFYPAQYWPHKNHVYILDAIEKLNYDLNLDFYAIFCGSDKGNLKHLKDYSIEKKISDKTIFLNFVDDEDLPYLYKLSKLLVMPSYFGPTNIPPLEAFQLKVPVIYSDIPTFKKEFGDAVYYVDLNNSNSLAKAIKKIYENKELREELIKNGLDKIEQIKLYNSEEILFELFDNYFKVELRWK